jgi:hypothetical protein
MNRGNTRAFSTAPPGRVPVVEADAVSSSVGSDMLDFFQEEI